MVRVLGPVCLQRPDGAFDALRGQQGEVLSLLAAAYPAPVSLDSLIDAVWGFDAPPSAATGLRVVMNRLRDRIGLGAEAIVNESGHYRLRLDRPAIDHVVFTDVTVEARAAADRGDSARAVALLEVGLALWRGDAFQPYESRGVHGVAQRLADQRSSAEDLLVEVLLECGRTEEALTRVSALMADFELRERRWELLMLALYRDGRQAEALRTYQQAANLFREEIGLEVGPRLRKLEQAILDHDPSLLLPSMPRGSRAPVTAGVALADLVSLLKVQPTAVPVAGTAFIGRAGEVEEILGLLTRRQLVTVLGPPGVGKTRVAGHVARSQSDRRILWIDLTAYSPDSVVQAMADQLDVRAPVAELAMAVADALDSEPTLVVLDNCERVADVAGLLAETLVRRCRDLQVVATSRVPLGCESETRFPLGPLSPEHGRQLLLERTYGAGAEAARTISQLHDRSLDELVVRLDCLPLALELAANALRTKSLPAVLEALATSPDVLASPRRTDGHHERWGTTLDWSIDALGPDDQRAFDHIGVLVGPFSGSDLRELAGSGTAGTLVDHSLLRTAAEHEHFVALETIRTYARSRLDQRGELVDARTRHAEHFAGLAAQAIGRSHGAEEPQTVARLLAAGANLRAAFEWAIEHGLASVAADLADHTWEHALFRLEFGLLAWAGRVLDRFDSDTPRYPEMLATAALGAWGDGDFARARELAEQAEAEADARQVRIPSRSIQAQFNVASQTGRPGDAENLILRHLDWCRRAKDVRQESSVLVNAAVGLAVLGDPISAASLAESAYTRAEATANPSALAWATYARAFVGVPSDPAKASLEFTEAARLARTVRNRFVLGVSLTGAAVAKRRAGEAALARSLLADAIELWTRGRMLAQQAWALKEAVVLLEAEGQHEEANRTARSISHLGPGQMLLPEDEAVFAAVAVRTSPSGAFAPDVLVPSVLGALRGQTPRPRACRPND